MPVKTDPGAGPGGGGPFRSGYDAPFRLIVEDVFVITGRGTVVTGRVESGTLRVGDEIEIQRGESIRRTAVSGIEAFRKRMEQASPGDQVGVLLREVGRDDVARGDVLAGILK